MTSEPKVEPQVSPNAAVSSQRIQILILLFVGICMTGGLIYPFPVSGRAWSALFDVAHAASFFCVFILMAGILDPSALGFSETYRPFIRLDRRRLSVLALTLFTAGAACELIQKFVDRQPSLIDVAANTSGLLAGLLFCLTLRNLKKTARWFAMVGVAALIILPSINPVMELVECYLKWSEFPLLASFERSRELVVWNPRNSIINMDSTWKTHGHYSLKIEAKKLTYPGAALIWQGIDWSQYSALELDLYNPQDEPLVVSINIADSQHPATGYDPTDRFSTHITLPAKTASQISIDLHDVEVAPISRKMDMTQIFSINIFMIEPKQLESLHVDNIRLRK